jgi:hypothetical protein
MVYLMAQMWQICVQLLWGIWVLGEGGRGGVGEWDQSTIVLSTYYSIKCTHLRRKRQYLIRCNETFIYILLANFINFFYMEEIEAFKFSSKFGVCDINWINEKRSKQFQNSYKCHTSKYEYRPTMSVFHWTWLISWIWALI